MLALNPAKTVDLLDGGHKYNAGGELTQNLFGEWLYVIPSSTLVVADDSLTAAMPMETVAAHYCHLCAEEVTPVPLSSVESGNAAGNTGWIHWPCHQKECDSCYRIIGVGAQSSVCENDCGKCDECCDCHSCSSCDVKVSDLCDGCSYCRGCCNCATCSYCGNKSEAVCPECWQCGDCCDGHEPRTKDCGCCTCCPCNCEDYDSDREVNTRYVIPGWIERGEKLPEDFGVSVKEIMADDLSRIDPVQLMADFYLCDYVIATGQMFANRVAGFNRWNDAYRPVYDAMKAAMDYQDYIVRTCDPAFRDYVFAAIGGEVRYHNNVNGRFPSSRQSTWDYWFAMLATCQRSDLVSDCVDLFGDQALWPVKVYTCNCDREVYGTYDPDCHACHGSGKYEESGTSVGGKNWRVCAEVLLKRETGEFDARTFVDRVFSLQHNGGSLLNKMIWATLNGESAGVEACKTVGDAHHAAVTDFETLFRYASDEALSIVFDTPAVILGSEVFGKVRDLGINRCGVWELDAEIRNPECARKVIDFLVFYSGAKITPILVCPRCQGENISHVSAHHQEAFCNDRPGGNGDYYCGWFSINKQSAKDWLIFHNLPDAGNGVTYSKETL